MFQLIMEPMFQQLGIAVLLGLLVGLQREHAASGIAGMRTFPLITVLGCLSAMLSIRMGGSWLLAAAFLGVVAVTVMGHLIQPRGNGEKGTGPICAHPEGRSGKLDLSLPPFPDADRIPASPPTWPCS